MITTQNSIQGRTKVKHDSYTKTSTLVEAEKKLRRRVYLSIKTITLNILNIMQCTMDYFVVTHFKIRQIAMSLESTRILTF